MNGAPAAVAAIQALPQLQCLTLTDTQDRQGRLPFAELEHPLRFTQLRLCLEGHNKQVQQLNQLSDLVNLGHLQLSGLLLYGVQTACPLSW